MRPPIVHLIAIVVLTSLAASVPGAPAASSGSVVGATIPSATSLDTTACAPNVPNKTDLGSLAVATTVRSTVDCSVVFGSSNDTAALRLGQRDGAGDALVRAEFGPQASTISNHLKGAALVDATTAWFAGYGGRIIKTTNGGALWSQQASGTTNRFYDIEAANATVAWATGELGVLVGTTNGATWTAQASGVGTDLNGLTSASPTRAWAVGSGGVIRTTSDGGATAWTAQNSTVVSDLHGIDAASSTVLWAVGDNGVVLKTTDGGSTWALQYTSTEWLRDVQAVSTQVAWATGRDGMVLRTVNGGTTWVPVTAPTTENLSDIAALDASVAWVVGDLGAVHVTYDAGVTWRDLSPGTTISFDSVMAIPGRAWIGGQSGELYVSPLDPVPDYVNGATDWDQGSAAFGVCISTLVDATTTWDDQAGCPLADGTWWRAVPDTTSSPGGELARTAALEPDATVHLNWAFRAGSVQPSGLYEASVVFEVVAPA